MNEPVDINQRAYRQSIRQTPSVVGFGLPRRYQPQTRPAPTGGEAAAVIAFVRTRLQVLPRQGAGQLVIADRLVASGGLLDRYRSAVMHGARPPQGLEQAWELVAATLAVEAADLAAAWPQHPDFDPSWVH
ncbi:MAG: hypothetical protein JWR24_472 [Actinoallomurus sp.]|nr:hypothetical protein [Actinoallomurus sp.]